MTKKLSITAFLVLFSVLISFGGKTHPNQGLIIGRWKPVQVERILPEKKAGSDTTKAMTKPDEKLERAIRAEERAPLDILPDYTATKTYHKNVVTFKWKLKGKGTKLIARNTKTYEKHILKVVEVKEDKLVLIETLGAVQLKVTYVRDK